MKHAALSKVHGDRGSDLLALSKNPFPETRVSWEVGGPAAVCTGKPLKRSVWCGGGLAMRRSWLVVVECG